MSLGDPIDPKRACFFQGRNGYGEDLPAGLAFRPFYPWSFALPLTTPPEHAEVLSWCAHVLDERSYGRWEEDFSVWHIGDEVAAEAFKAAWITPYAIAKPAWGAPKVTDAP